jgi:hypothetical protein
VITGVAWLSAMVSLLYIDSNRYPEAKRKRLILAGAVSMFVCDTLIAFLINEALVTFLSSLVFVICFEMTLGPVM